MTAETALALPAVVLVLAVAVATFRVATAQLQCTDAARAAARQAARGEPVATVEATARQAGPPGAEVALARVGGSVSVEVAAAVRLPVPGWSPLRVRDRVIAAVEQQ